VLSFKENLIGAVVTWDSIPHKAIWGTNKSIPGTENTGRTDPEGLCKLIPHRVNRSLGDQNSQA